MKAQYFDCWEFRHIFHLIETNPNEAKLQMEDYLKNFPYDHSAYTYYAYVLIVLGYFDEAEQVLENVKMTYVNDANFMKDKKKVKLISENIIFNTFKLLSYQGRYKELLDFCKENMQIIRKLKLNSLDFYCKKKLGIKCPETIEKFSYLFRQIDNYSEDDFLDHIKKHLADFNQDVDEPNEYVFVPDFPLTEVLSEVKKHIGSDKKLFSGFYEDLYIFRYDCCGRVKNKLVNYFRVVALNGTDNFITMFPADDCETMPYIDLNHLSQKNENPKVKKLSQIDKFNQRYGRK